LTLSEVAKAVNMSAFYFCKMFRQATGLTFTDYLARIRVEKVKHMLLNPHKRVSEVAFAAGFQSLSQFNRVFRKVAGEAPSSYRERIHRTAAA
jgi:AraC-like DNA-binding protein